jgi:hypothetical protein
MNHVLNRRWPRIVISIALATFAAFEIGAAVRETSALAQLNPAPVVVPGTSSGASAPPVTPLTSLALPAASPAAATTAAPGAPAALATAAALPVLQPAPIVIAAVPTAVPQSIYRCSCFGVGIGVQWIGQVQATSYVGASQSAQGQCSSFVKATTGAQSPYISPPGGISVGRNVFPGVNPNLAPGDVVTVPRNPVATEASASSVVASEETYCARCACN